MKTISPLRKMLMERHASEKNREAAGQTRASINRSLSPGLRPEPKLIRNAISTDWPAHFLANKNTLVINPAK